MEKMLKSFHIARLTTKKDICYKQFIDIVKDVEISCLSQHYELDILASFDTFENAKKQFRSFEIWEKQTMAKLTNKL